MFELFNDDQTQRNNEFHRACLTGDTVKALRILDENPNDPHLIDVTRSDMPAILVASHAQAWDLCRQLIVRGVFLNVKNRQGYSPIHVYAEHGHEELIKLAVEHAAVINRRDNKGQTPLYFAAKKNQDAAVDLIVSLGGSAKTLTNDKDSPLHCAARNDNLSMAIKLMDNGALATVENDMGETPVSLAKTDALKSALERYNLNRIVQAVDNEPTDSSTKSIETPPDSAETVKPKRRILKA